MDQFSLLLGLLFPQGLAGPAPRAGSRIKALVLMVQSWGLVGAALPVCLFLMALAVGEASVLLVRATQGCEKLPGEELECGVEEGCKRYPFLLWFEPSLTDVPQVKAGCGQWVGRDVHFSRALAWLSCRGGAGSAVSQSSSPLLGGFLLTSFLHTAWDQDGGYYGKTALGIAWGPGAAWWHVEEERKGLPGPSPEPDICWRAITARW